MRERFSAWAFPVKWPGDSKRSRWKRFEEHHEFLAMLVAIVCVAGFVTALLGALYVLDRVSLIGVVVWLWAGIFIIGIPLAVVTQIVDARKVSKGRPTSAPAKSTPANSGNVALQWAIGMGFLAFILALWITRPYMPWLKSDDPTGDDRRGWDDWQEAQHELAESGRYDGR